MNRKIVDIPLLVKCGRNEVRKGFGLDLALFLNGVHVDAITETFTPRVRVNVGRNVVIAVTRARTVLRRRLQGQASPGRFYP